jgi:hypothetical protein
MVLLEPVQGDIRREGFHLGECADFARKAAVERFDTLNAVALETGDIERWGVRTVALLKKGPGEPFEGRRVSIYYGNGLWIDKD